MCRGQEEKELRIKFRKEEILEREEEMEQICEGIKEKPKSPWCGLTRLSIPSPPKSKISQKLHQIFSNNPSCYLYSSRFFFPLPLIPLVGLISSSSSPLFPPRIRKIPISFYTPPTHPSGLAKGGWVLEIKKRKRKNPKTEKKKRKSKIQGRVCGGSGEEVDGVHIMYWASI